MPLYLISGIVKTRINILFSLYRFRRHIFSINILTAILVPIAKLCHLVFFTFVVSTCTFNELIVFLRRKVYDFLKYKYVNTQSLGRTYTFANVCRKFKKKYAISPNVHKYVPKDWKIYTIYWNVQKKGYATFGRSYYFSKYVYIVYIRKVWRKYIISWNFQRKICKV